MGGNGRETARRWDGSPIRRTPAVVRSCSRSIGLCRTTTSRPSRPTFHHHSHPTLSRTSWDEHKGRGQLGQASTDRMSSFSQAPKVSGGVFGKRRDVWIQKFRRLHILRHWLRQVLRHPTQNEQWPRTVPRRSMNPMTSRHWIWDWNFGGGSKRFGTFLWYGRQAT